LIEPAIFGLSNLDERAAGQPSGHERCGSDVIVLVLNNDNKTRAAVQKDHDDLHDRSLNTSIAEFLALLQEVRRSARDVRSIPRSRTNPQFNADAFPATLAEAGIAYRHLPALGGLRHRTKAAEPSPNTLWRVAAFRNYADYVGTDAFRTGLGELRALARDHCCAIMCAEAVWWRCHRRIIADYLLGRGVPVMHIMGSGKPAPQVRGAPVLATAGSA
jgi:uncharacterized protein (DUF488 family)